jgi:Flp pilus assembly protein TadD
VANARRAYEWAIAIAAELLAVNAQDFRTIALVALCEAKLGRTAAAERHVAEARTLAPTDRETLQRSAEVHARLGDTDTAMRDLRAAIEQGYGKREARENDELLALRSLPAFQQLTEEAPAPQ